MKLAAATVLCVALCLAALAGFLTPGAAALSTGDPSWQWQAPLPQGNGLADVEFLTADGGWAVGQYGTILHTSDGGDSWTAQASGTRSDLASVAFVDALHGWAVGEGGVVVCTADGGVTWELQPTPTADDLEGVYFVDRLRGWVVGAFAGAYRTVDGGQTWAPVTFPWRSRPGPTDVWASGTGEVVMTTEWQAPLIRSTDDGATWRRVKGPLQSASALAFVSPAEGWAAGVGETIMHTVDAGASWSRQHLPARLWVDALDFVDGRHGWLCSDEGVYGTVDGGASWSRLLAGTSRPAATSFVSPVRGCLVGGAGSVRITTDGGKTWRAPAATAGAGRPRSLNAVAFADALNGCAVGSRGAVLQTIDGGATWAARASGTTQDLRDVESARGTGIVYALGDHVLLKSPDGGTTWAVLPTGVKATWATISAPDASHVTIAGELGRWAGPAVVLRSADAGLHWSRVTVGDGLEPVSMSFPDAANGWLTTTDHRRTNARALWHTTDGGATWRLQRRIWDGWLIDVCFIDARNGWMTAEDEAQFLLRTTDGGETWSTVDTGYQVETGGLYTGLQFTDAGHGWVLADYAPDLSSSSACLFRTTDGGAHWSVEGIGSAGEPRAIAAVGSQDVWIVGTGRMSYGGSDGGGQILHAADGGGTAPRTSSTLKDRWWPLFVKAPVTVTLSVRDAGSGVAGAWYRVDRFTNVWDWGAKLGTWLPASDGEQIEFPAPSDHSADGYYRLRYYSADLLGTREYAHVRMVTVDTLGPDCAALRPEPVLRGHNATLRYRVHDATTAHARVTLTVRAASGRVVLQHTGSKSLIPDGSCAGVWRFPCRLAPGRYRFDVRAVDEAGNAQVHEGRAVLVVRGPA